jgi:hypothetical protein
VTVRNFRLQCFGIRFLAAAALSLGCLSLSALEPWQAALHRMPLSADVSELTRSNTVSVMLRSFQKNDAAKAFIFMPGATDELYFFNRGYARLEKRSPSLWEAIAALTNQTLIRVSFREPFVLLHSMEDPLDPLWKIEDEDTAVRIRKKKFAAQAMYDDRDWDFMHPLITFYTATKITPGQYMPGTTHFYRHSFAGWNLTAWEALEAISLAGKTTFTVQKRVIVFKGDKRFREKPPVPTFP